MKKTLFIIAGANGSGKTTFAKEFCKANNLEFLNTDEIAKHCKSDIEAGRKFLKAVKEKLNQNNSFVIETFVLVAKDNQIYINELYKKFLEDLNGK